ncbi:MAG: hypothetical protein PVF96_05655 [Candidatus Bathyarchaeota archaeon]
MEKAIKEELFAKRKQLKSLNLTLPPKILGDYYEGLLRKFIQKKIHEDFKAKAGVIYDNQRQCSRECDIIIYRKGEVPLFDDENFVIIDKKHVQFVLEVKNTLDSNKLSQAINTLKEVKKLDNHIMCWIIGFETKMLIKTLYQKALDSKSVQFLHAFHSDMPTECKQLIDNQMKFFMQTIHNCGRFNRYSWTNDFVIYWDEGRRLALTEEKEKNESILRLVQDEDFWRKWENGEIGETMFERPRN